MCSESNPHVRTAKPPIPTARASTVPDGKTDICFSSACSISVSVFIGQLVPYVTDQRDFECHIAGPSRLRPAETTHHHLIARPLGRALFLFKNLHPFRAGGCAGDDRDARRRGAEVFREEFHEGGIRLPLSRWRRERYDKRSVRHGQDGFLFRVRFHLHGNPHPADFMNFIHPVKSRLAGIR